MKSPFLIVLIVVYALIPVIFFFLDLTNHKNYLKDGVKISDIFRCPVYLVISAFSYSALIIASILYPDDIALVSVFILAMGAPAASLADSLSNRARIFTRGGLG